jgi:8-oxo-dGTP diphosphatase
LGAFNIRRVVTSPWKRCLDTVKPFGKKQKLKIIERSQLSELGNKRNPAKTTRVIKDSLKEHKSMILCTHRPALPTVLDTISDYAKNDKSVEIHEGRTLAPAEMMVIRMSLKTRQVVGVETYNAPEIAYPNLPVT